jgi:hypothetical protein
MKYTLKGLLDLYKVVVPLIQRDYAQGRNSELDLRKDFIGKIKRSLDYKSLPLGLDFIYGYTEKISNDIIAFIPLDGQQRLTTLWLIHWYLAPRETIKLNGDEVNIISTDVKAYLGKFTYETRTSSKRFCDRLVTQSLPNADNTLISELIKDASWFMASWNNDPTIVSMLNMLETIQAETFNKPESWKNLINGEKVTFDFIDIKSDEFKLTDELYIKMNSRGKTLTPFENFKAQFSGLLSSKQTDYLNDKMLYQNAKVNYQQYFAFKIDSVWMDLFWNYRTKVTTSTDDCILNYIYFIAEFLYFKSNPDAASADVEHDFDFLNRIFSIKQNIKFLFNSLDFLVSLSDIDSFFNELFKDLATFDNYPKDYFLRAISDTGFDVKDKTIFYAVLTYCIDTNSKVADDELKHFIRIVRNQLLAVRQPNQSKRIEYSTNLRLPNVSEYCKFIDELLKIKTTFPQKSIYEILSDNNFNGFPKENIGNEKSKACLICANPKLQQSIFLLEDHRFIEGNTLNFKLNANDVANKIAAFLEIWADGVEDSKIIRAFLSIDDYSVNTHPYSSLGEIWYFGSTPYWNRILTTNDKEDKKKVSDILDDFLMNYIKAKGNNTDERLQFIIDKFKPKTKDWRYYFAKYIAITKNPYRNLNLFTWEDKDGFNINNLGNSGNLPLHSFHLNPYITVLKQYFNTNDKIMLYWGRFTEISFLRIANNVDIKCINAGWKISPIDAYVINKKLINKFNLSQQDDYYVLTETDNKDRVEIAIELIEELIK